MRSRRAKGGGAVRRGENGAAMDFAIVGADGSIESAAGHGALLEAKQQEGAFAWIDCVDPESKELDDVQRTLDLHPLSTEEAADVHQRGIAEAYPAYWFIVAHALVGSAHEPAASEVAIFAGEKFVLTVRHAPAWPFDLVRKNWAMLRGLRRGPGAFVYAILDAIVDGYLPYIAECESRLEAIEARLLEQSRRESRGSKILAEIIDIKGVLQQMRHVVGPMQDVIERISRGDVRIFQDDEMVYYHSVGTHVRRMLARIDSLNDTVATALTLNLSIAQNRQADIARQLTIIATIFLPLTFITGFFGQNFGWLVEHIQSGPSFFIWGLGTEVAAVALLLWFFVIRRWL